MAPPISPSSKFPGVRPDELNQPDELPGPADHGGAGGDWYTWASARLFASRAEARALVDDWMFDIRPPTDDRPFFLDFGKLSSIGALREAFGALWLTRAELAYLFVLAATAAIAVAAALMTLLPLLALRPVRAASDKLRTGTYFLAIGLGYLLLEMMVLSRLTHLLGDPVHAAAITIGTFLFLSGVGSTVIQSSVRRGRTPLRVPLIALTVVALLEVALLVPVVRFAGGFPFGWRLVAGIVVIAPMATLMGMPMPAGLTRVDRAHPALVPWARGINGFASVLAAPLALVLAMTWSYRVTGGLALAMYALAAATTPGEQPPPNDPALGRSPTWDPPRPHCGGSYGESPRIAVQLISGIHDRETRTACAARALGRRSAPARGGHRIDDRRRVLPCAGEESLPGAGDRGGVGH